MQRVTRVVSSTSRRCRGHDLDGDEADALARLLTDLDAARVDRMPTKREHDGADHGGDVDGRRFEHDRSEATTTHTREADGVGDRGIDGGQERGQGGHQRP